MNLRRWLREHSLRILALRDSPAAIARGVGIGIFFGFMPVPGLKTVSAIFFAWLTGSNIVAAVVTGALHDVFLPVMPAVYLWEYELGFWLLSSPHHWPPGLEHLRWPGTFWHFWKMFAAMGKPLLLGGFVCSAPAGIAAFAVTHMVVARHQRRRRAEEAAAHGHADQAGRS